MRSTCRRGASRLGSASDRSAGRACSCVACARALPILPPTGNQQSWFMVISHNINLFAFVMVYIFRANSYANTPDADTVTVDADTFYFYRSAVEYRISATHMQVCCLVLC